MWSIVAEINNNRKSGSVNIALEREDRVVEDPASVADLLNECFIVTKL